ncbi:hypothetical protein BZG36_01788 [Bifiguratus adelaidae]|uniref:RNA-binding S4 domain-containing protein n=1 Tax=Bifiguratus adelaidae TaxID=1938954 RepID=A0A261Y276_9FUNG|nr:hypothetical protein BZG36_01788 [Bifiguratus adelaidae]
MESDYGLHKEELENLVRIVERVQELNRAAVEGSIDSKAELDRLLKHHRLEDVDDPSKLELVHVLEKRLQTRVFRSGLASDMDQARLMVKHRWIKIDGKVNNSPGYIVQNHEERSIVLDPPPDQQEAAMKGNNPMSNKKRKHGSDDDSDPRKKFTPDEMLEGANYYFEHGLRKVVPYFFLYKTFAKKRWLGRTVFDVFSTEFRDQTSEYYRSAIEKGLVMVNNETCAIDQKLKQSDLISHKIHRHEPPVTASKINIIHRDDDLLVINKPGSIPVHPSGRYRHNTITHILMKEYGFKHLFPINRLDRLTSGVMFLGLTPAKASEFEALLHAREIHKEYVCRVLGEFPENVVNCTEPIKTVAHKLGLNCVDPDGKPSATEFERLSYNGRTSVVIARPKTGRTHQIRVHLQFLGYPIANDPLYCNEVIWGEDLGKAFLPSQQQQVIERLSAAKAESTQLGGAAIPTPKNRQSASIPETCEHCHLETLFDPEPDQLYIWLHAYKYNGDDWCYTTEMPEWSQKDYDDAKIVQRHQELARQRALLP